jgi:autotransporter-associated beta strand protein
MAAEHVEKRLKRRALARECLVGLFLVATAARAFGVTLASWDFNSVPPDADATTGTLQPATGSGTASLVGTVTGSFTASNGSSDPNTTDNSNWRITTWPAQGTQNKQNGIQFNISTVGYQLITLEWDLRNSNTASKYSRLQYTTNGTDFIDFQVITMPFETWVNSQTANLSAVPGVANNPNFGVRFVAEFESTAIGSTNANYVPCNPTNTYGSAGTLRFDMVYVFGVLQPVTNFTVLTYNVLGRHVTDWTTNSAQVQAIGRQLSYLKPDIVGFQEIPEVNAGYTQMTNFVAAYLPGYYLAYGSYADGVERSVIASRFPIARSKSWLIGANLTPYGYNGKFTRDLFEAQITVPEFDQPFHFFVTHLQAGSTQDESTRRGAEARCISNYFAAIYLTTNSTHPYCLVGDMNEDIYRPRDYELQAIQTLTSSPTGLWLTTPTNPATGDERTWSSRNANPTIRFDYLLPSEMLFTNVMGGQVFRSDKISPEVPPMLAGDSATSSDHLPVLLVLHNPYVGRLDQTINFGALADKVYGNSPFSVSATASSGLSVSFSIRSGPATISGNTVTIAGAGTVTVRATQPGNTFYNAAPPVDQSFTVNKAAQIITFGALAARTYGDNPFTVSATASSGLLVGFNIQSGPATINGSTVTLTGAGTVKVRATQGGNTNYNAALPVDRSFTVNQANSTTALTASQNPSCLGSPVTLTATVTGVSPGGSVQFFDGASPLGTAALSSGQAILPVSSLSPGTHATMTAQYAGDANHNGSTSAGYTHVVAEGPLKWAGGDADWNSLTAGTWKDNRLNDVRYCDTYAAVLDDTATGTSPITITLNSAVSPASVTVSNSSIDYVISGSAGIAGASATLTKQGNGTLTLSGVNSYRGNTTVNAGTLALGASGSINNSPVIAVGSGATYDVSAVSGGYVLASGQTLKGTGSVTGAMTVASGATLAPGASIGTLTVNGNLTLNSGSQTGVEVNRAELSSDRVTGIGTLTEGSTLTVTNIGDALQINDSFPLLSATTYDGEFVAISPASPNSDPELAWDKPALKTNGLLRIHHVPYATNYVTLREKGMSASIMLSDLFPTPDPLDEDIVVLESFTAGSQSAIITRNGISISYSPVNDNNDSFDYTVMDGRGEKRTRTVTIQVSDSVGRVTITNIGGGQITMSFTGIAGQDYVVQRSSNLVDWVRLATNTAPATGPDIGRIRYTETPPHNPTYYRTWQP